MSLLRSEENLRSQNLARKTKKLSVGYTEKFSLGTGGEFNDGIRKAWKNRIESVSYLSGMHDLWSS